MKAWWKSRTIWLNLLALLAVVIQEWTGQDILTPEVQVAILAALNTILRFRTNEGVQ